MNLRSIQRCIFELLVLDYPIAFDICHVDDIINCLFSYFNIQGSQNGFELSFTQDLVTAGANWSECMLQFFNLFNWKAIAAVE